jgi:hypothetical protein
MVANCLSFFGREIRYCCKLMLVNDFWFSPANVKELNDLQSVHSRRTEREKMEAKAWMLRKPESSPTSASQW